MLFDPAASSVRPHRMWHSGRSVLDVLVFIGFFILILASGVWATNIYCRFAYNQCSDCDALNAKRRSECRKCGASLAAE